nr:unnamed protein product [Callosobruchus analis]
MEELNKEHIRLCLEDIRKDALRENSRMYIKQFNESVQLNRRFMKLPIPVVLYLGKQELAFRGHAEVRQYHKIIASLFAGNSKMIQNEIVDCIAIYIDEYIEKEIKDCQFFSIQVDDSTDIGQKSQCSIIVRYVFCGTHDMPLRGKQADEGVLLDLLKLRIDSGDNKLKSHFEKCRRNAIYTSPRIQNELINLCGEVIQENVISEVRKTMAYSILADETADVSGKEQLSIGVRFYDESKSKIREEFVGFVELKAQNASAIAEAIDNFLISSNLSKEDCVGFGFDGCSTMAGKEGGVQAILRKKYPRALYFHCSSHKLNLVVNDANAVPEIRNTVATVKDVITFFRESTTRRNYAPNLSRLCETRWSEKYKSIRKFSQHFSELVKSLETLSVEGNYATRKSAYQLHSAVTKPVFIVSLQTIAKYSAVIEPVVNALQAKSIDMISVGKHIKNIKDILRNDREFPDRIKNTPAFALSRLHPLYMTKTSIADLHKNAESFQEFYNLDITGELNLWHNLWVTKALSDDQLKDIEVVDLFKEANIFYPAVRKALIILSTIPCTTATVERSFSTLRRVKTWLRSTMGEERLTGLCLMSMEEDKKIMTSEMVTYVFASANQQDMLKDAAPTGGRLWQVVPCTCASLICIPFGLMLGWPSPTYPYLVSNSTSPIQITMDQSAMIAGFLMLGNTLGTPISATESMGPKLLVGLGHGFGMGQVKLYICGICSEDLQLIFLKIINFYTLAGVIAIYSFGPFLRFRETSLICLILSVSLVFFMAFLPATPKELIKAKKFSDARRLISYIKPHLNVTNEVNMLKESLSNASETHGIVKLIRIEKLRGNFLIFFIISVFQQFTGAPATLVYTQILFERSHVPYAPYFAIGYVCLFFLANIIGIFIIPKYNKKMCYYSPLPVYL